MAMFVRAKKSGDYECLQIVENQRIDGKVRRQVVATLGRLDICVSSKRYERWFWQMPNHMNRSMAPERTVRILRRLKTGKLNCEKYR